MVIKVPSTWQSIDRNINLSELAGNKPELTTEHFISNIQPFEFVIWDWADGRETSITKHGRNEDAHFLHSHSDFHLKSTLQKEDEGKR